MEQINQENKPEVKKIFQLHIDAIRSAVDNIEKLNQSFSRKKSTEEQ
jgi:hypothetical protein